ncbi:DUF1622 domain-containing protein [Enterococcus sp. LJL120]
MHLNDQLMDYVRPFFDVFVFILSSASILILIIGVVHALIQFGRSQLSKKTWGNPNYDNTIIKNKLGSYILLSLEVLIAADIIESVINPTLADIFKLAALVVIRTVISYFLAKEIKDFEIIQK